jgi:hypothetical protein
MNIVKFNSKLDISITHTHMSSRKHKKDIFLDSGFQRNANILRSKFCIS